MAGVLHGEAADPAGAGVDQNALARMQARDVVERGQRGEADER